MLKSCCRLFDTDVSVITPDIKYRRFFVRYKPDKQVYVVIGVWVSELYGGMGWEELSFHRWFLAADLKVLLCYVDKWMGRL